MRILIAEDDLISRKIILKILSQYGDCDVTVDGMEALDAYLLAIKENNPYDLICLDIMMPKIDGVRVLKAIRTIEQQKEISMMNRAKIIMLTALADKEYVAKSFEIGCEAYATKPIDTAKLVEVLQKLDLIK
ncbi:MAG: response regulator receiver protein [Firmicutes bacterium]|nr:response regulator receiver protein [Bacillota bacterium]